MPILGSTLEGFSGGGGTAQKNITFFAAATPGILNNGWLSANPAWEIFMTSDIVVDDEDSFTFLLTSTANKVFRFWDWAIDLVADEQYAVDLECRVTITGDPLQSNSRWQAQATDDPADPFMGINDDGNWFAYRIVFVPFGGTPANSKDIFSVRLRTEDAAGTLDVRAVVMTKLDHMGAAHPSRAGDDGFQSADPVWTLTTGTAAAQDTLNAGISGSDGLTFVLFNDWANTPTPIISGTEYVIECEMLWSGTASSITSMGISGNNWTDGDDSDSEAAPAKDTWFPLSIQQTAGGASDDVEINSLATGDTSGHTIQVRNWKVREVQVETEPSVPV